MNKFDRLKFMKEKMLKGNDIYINAYLNSLDNVLNKKESIIKITDTELFRKDLLKLINLSKDFEDYDKDKIIEFYVYNPTTVYYGALEDLKIYKKYIFKNSNTIYSRITIKELITKYEKITSTLIDDFDKKLEEGYFNIDEKINTDIPL